MRECGICYEATTKLQYLDCCHYLCFACLSKLQQKKCPFCRQQFSTGLQNQVDPPVMPLPSENLLVRRYEPPVARVRIRRRRNRHRTITERIDSVAGQILVECPARQRKRHRRGDNRRRGSWARGRGRNRAVRHSR